MRPVQDSSSSSSFQQSLKTKRGANFHFHFRTSTLSRCSHPDRPGTSYNISSTPSVSHSVGRAVPCPCRVVTLTLEPKPPGQQRSPPSHLPLFSLHHLAVDLGSQPPSFLPSQPASQPDLFLVARDSLSLDPTACLPTSLPDLPGLPAPSPPFGTWEPTCAPERPAPASDWTWTWTLTSTLTWTRP